MKVHPGSRSSLFLLVLGLFLVLGTVSDGLSESKNPQCAELRSDWEKLVQNLKDNLQEYRAIQKAPLEQITQRPLVDYSEGKTIARQISEAILEKERLLSAKRKECRNVLNKEHKAFREFETCSKSESKGKKEQRAWKKLSRHRKKLLDKALLAITEVRAVEGQNTVMPYSQAYQDPYRGPANYWQNYQQRYQGYWGR
jgi:hypothetical protein